MAGEGAKVDVKEALGVCDEAPVFVGLPLSEVPKVTRLQWALRALADEVRAYHDFYGEGLPSEQAVRRATVISALETKVLRLEAQLDALAERLDAHLSHPVDAPPTNTGASSYVADKIRRCKEGVARLLDAYIEELDAKVEREPEPTGAVNDAPAEPGWYYVAKDGIWTKRSPLTADLPSKDLGGTSGFTYDEVLAAICPYCRDNVPSFFDGTLHDHRLSFQGKSIPCLANDWRRSHPR